MIFTNSKVIAKYTQEIESDQIPALLAILLCYHRVKVGEICMESHKRRMIDMIIRTAEHLKLHEEDTKECLDNINIALKSLYADYEKSDNQN